MTKNERTNLKDMLENYDVIFGGWGYEPSADDVEKFLASDPNSKVRKFFKDQDACFEGSWPFYRFKTVEAAIRYIHANQDYDAIEYFLNSQDIDTWDVETKRCSEYSLKELLDLIPAAYRTKKAKKATKKGAKSAKSSRRRR